MKKCFKIITTLCLFTCFVWGAFTACSNSVDSDSPKKEEPVQEPEPELPPEPKEFTITFNANDGSENPATATQKFTEGTAQALKTISELGFSRDGYNFAGWATKADATQADFADGTSYSAKANTTLYALWTVLSYDISLIVDGPGRVSLSSKKASAGEEIIIYAYADDGYNLSSCEVIDSGSNSVLVENNKFIMPDKDVTVTVKFWGVNATFANIEDIITNAKHDVNIKLTGSLSDDDILTIKKMILKSANMVELDLSEVTGLTKIPYEGFQYCDKLKGIILPDSVTKLGGYSFWDCKNLSYIIMPDTVTEIGSFSFDDCFALKTITLPENLQYIREGAFYDCTGLEEVIIPASVNMIVVNAFKGNNLRSLKFEDPNDWYYVRSYQDCLNRTGGTPEDFTDASANPKKLRNNSNCFYKLVK